MKPSTPKIELPPSTQLRKAVFGRATRKAALLLFSMALLLAGGAAAVRGQSALDGFDPNANAPVQVVVVQPDGKLVIVGNFTTLAPNGGAAVTRNHIARLNPDGTLDTAFNPDANGSIYAVTVQADGKILVGGVFTGIGGQARTNIARLDAISGLADSFNPNANGEVDAITVLADGRILVGGVFTGIGGQTRNGIARLDGITGLADSFNPNATGNVYAIVVQADGRILVAGTFTNIGGQTRNRIARLDATTGLADAFNPNANDIVYAIALQADGKVLAAGNFSGANSLGGQTRNHIARLDAATGLADAFDPNASDNVYTLAVQADGKVLAGGVFSTLSPNGGSAVTRTGLARLNPDGLLDPVFSPNANGVVVFIAVQADGKILAGGGFTSLAPSGGTPVTRNRLARLERDGQLDRTLNFSAEGLVLATAVQPDGKILIGGAFNTVLGVTRNYIARLNPDGTLDTAFDPNADQELNSIAVQADGKILAGGARLNNDTAALQNLAVTQSTITWTRGGSSPQLARVTFESSTNNVNYTPLGNGTASGSNWTLTGLNLATGQNLYIRARGYYRGGYQNGSESIQESVRNAFLATPQPRLNIQRSATTNVVLSWATNFTGFTLEANTKNVWSVVSPAPAVSGTNNVVTNAVSGSARFYRLHRP